MKGNINYEAFINFDCCKKSNYYQFTKIIQDLFYLDEFILDSLIIHLENCTIYHDESAIAFCIQYQNNDYEYIFNETKQNIYLSINKRNNQFIDLITYLNKYHFLNNNHFYIFNQISKI